MFSFKVTEEHIAKAREILFNPKNKDGYHCYSCPIALAAKEYFKNEDITTDGYKIYFNGPLYQRKLVDIVNVIESREFVISFDYNLPVKPFEVITSEPKDENAYDYDCEQ